MSERPIPMIDDLALDFVTSARQRTVQRSLSLPVPGLAGDVQQTIGRASHEIELHGMVTGGEAADKLSQLQEKAGGGEEVTFTSDITSALELEKVIVVEAEFRETGGRPGCFDYRIVLRESPPLPPPAQLSPFGGLDGLGIDGMDLGFDTDVLGDISDMAGELQGAMDQVTGALSALDALAGLGDLSLGNPLTPFQEKAGEAGSVGADASDAADCLSNLLGGS